MVVTNTEQFVYAQNFQDFKETFCATVIDYYFTDTRT